MDPGILDPSVLAPAAWLGIGAMVVLMGEVFLARGASVEEAGTRAKVRLGTTLAGLASVAVVLAIYTAGSNFVADVRSVFNPAHPMLQMDPLSSAAMVGVGAATLLSVMLSITYLPVLHINHGEYYALILLSTAGMFVMVTAVDLIAVFMGLELMSVPIYALAGFDRRKLRSNESGIKYFLIGAFASAILLYGMALLYGATGHTGFAGLSAGFDPDSALAMAGLGLVLVGFTFKIAAVPFHQWTPDVYEGAPTTVTAFMSVTVKLAAFVVLLRFLELAVPGRGASVGDVLWGLSALSMVVGNVMAVIQTNVKRMLAYSSVAHAGYVLVGFVAGTPGAHSAILFYLLAYVFMNLGAFGVVIALARSGRENERIDDFAGLAQVRPGLAAVMTLFLLALAGIPGTAGFMAKFYLFSSAVNAGYVTLAIVGVLSSVVSVYYYLRLPVVMYMREPLGEEVSEASTNEVAVLALCAIAVIWLGLLPNQGLVPALDLAARAVAGLP
ncbi:MAG: NADH-quinone oxidoreductase subunit N [Myxococcota bacterium]